MLEIEKCILGAILLNNKVLDKCMLFLEVKDFKDGYNQLIYQTMVKNKNNNIVNDYITIHKEMKQITDIDIFDYLIELANYVPTAENIDSHIKIIREHNNLESIVGTLETIKNKNMETAPAIQLIEDTIDNLTYVDNTETSNLNENIKEYLHSIADGKDLEKCIPTLYELLDRKLMIRNGNFIVIGARPAVGKSAYVLNLVKHFAMQKQKVLFISLEMTKEEILNRLVAMVSGINVSRIINKKLNSYEIQQVLRTEIELKKYNIKIFDRGSLNIENLINLTHKLKTKGQVDILVVDYIGLLGSKLFRESRVNQVGYISRKLKQIAMDLKIPVIALAQLNRNVVDKGNGRSRKPVLADLRDSGSIEQDANVVMFLHQEEDTTHDDRFLKLILAKNRSGETGEIDIVFKTKTMTFVESEFRDGNFVQLKPMEIENIFE